MTPNSSNEEKMERLIHQTLRDLPPRRAPQSLEHRVLVELRRRGALPWWRKSFVHWPVAARAAFIVLSAGLVKLALMFGVCVTAGFDIGQYKEAFPQQFAWMESGLAVVHAAEDFFAIMARNIPSLWLYAGLAFFATMYAALFGLGAAAYKVIHVQR
jgi:hypothetical protein